MHRQKRFVPTRLTLLIPVMLMALGNAAAQESPLLGSSRTLTQTSFCRTYVCSKPVSGSTPAEGLKTLTYKVTKPAGREYAETWNIITTSKGGKVVSVRWSVIFQDYFISDQSLAMALKLSQIATGRTVEKPRLKFMEEAAMSGNYTTPARLGNGHVYSMFQKGGIGERLFSLVFTNLNPANALWSEPPRNFMNNSEKLRVLTRMSEELNRSKIPNQGPFFKTVVGPCGKQPLAIKITHVMGNKKFNYSEDWGISKIHVFWAGKNNGFSSRSDLYDFEGPAGPVHTSFGASMLTIDFNDQWDYMCIFIVGTSWDGKEDTAPGAATYK